MQKRVGLAGSRSRTRRSSRMSAVQIAAAVPPAETQSQFIVPSPENARHPETSSRFRMYPIEREIFQPSLDRESAEHVVLLRLDHHGSADLSLAGQAITGRECCAPEEERPRELKSRSELHTFFLLRDWQNFLARTRNSDLARRPRRGRSMPASKNRAAAAFSVKSTVASGPVAFGRAAISRASSLSVRISFAQGSS